jgi:hypothetical protein
MSVTVLQAFGMRARGLALRAAGLVLAAALLAPGAAGAADGETVRLSYDAYLGPFYVVSAEAELRLAGDRYRVVTRARSEGIASMLFSWQSEARSEGMRAGRQLLPLRHEVDGEWRGELRQIRLSYADAYAGPDDAVRPIDFQVKPPVDTAERDPVPAALTVGTVDPLSATLSVLLRIAGGGRCEGQLAVFDGRRRYDMIVRPGAPAVLPAVHSSIFSGAAQRCDFELRRIAGFWKKDSRFGRRVTDPVLWVASPLDGVPPVPVRFTAETGFGDLRIHLTRVQRGRQILALPES